MKNINKCKLTECGIGSLASLAILAVIVLIGIASWFVYKSNRDNSAYSANSTSSDSQQLTTDIKEERSGYFEISELNIKIPSTKLEYIDLEYTVNKVNGTNYTRAYVYSSSLSSILKSKFPEVAKNVSYLGSVEIVAVPTADFDQFGRISYPRDGGELNIDESVTRISNLEVFVIQPTIMDFGTEYLNYVESMKKATSNAITL